MSSTWLWEEGEWDLRQVEKERNFRAGSLWAQIVLGFFVLMKTLMKDFFRTWRQVAGAHDIFSSVFITHSLVGVLFIFLRIFFFVAPPPG